MESKEEKKMKHVRADNEEHQLPRKKKHRHTPFQIHQLEKFFNGCPHPTEKQRLELSKQLHLETRQVKFWFQNHRHQLKNDVERLGNKLIKEENDKIMYENKMLKDMQTTQLCRNCGSPKVPRFFSLEGERLLIENARLKQELARVTSLVSMDEVVHMARTNEPLWTKHPELGDHRDVLNLEEYAGFATLWLPLKRDGFVTEASRETGYVMISGAALVDMLMDVHRWAVAFSGVVANCSIVDVICHGVDGSRDGSLQLMQADFQVISPMVPARRSKFLRFCKKRDDGVWVVVDVSHDASPDGLSSRLPSGCVTWVEHSEYDETLIHPMLQPVIRSGKGFGAGRWLSTLQRHCECLNILRASPSIPVYPSGWWNTKRVLKLTKRMMENFCSGVVDNGSNGGSKWERVDRRTELDVKILKRKSLDKTSGVVLAASTSVWLPVSRQRLFDFLNDHKTRKDWDILRNGRSMQEICCFPMARDAGNCVSFLDFVASGSNVSESEGTNRMVILQETQHDASGSMVVFAPVDVASLDGGNNGPVDLLSSGFAVLPDGRDQQNFARATATDKVVEGAGSILTVGFQILPTGKVNMASAVDTVNDLLSDTIQRIKTTPHL
ncbi:Homeobox-leucine zipper protein HDG7 [Linum grandiflorum]